MEAQKKVRDHQTPMIDYIVPWILLGEVATLTLIIIYANKFMEIHSMLKRFFKDKDSKMLAKEGIEDESGALTEKGKLLVLELIYRENRPKIVEMLASVQGETA